MNDEMLIRFLNLLQNAPSSVLLIAFAVWMLKKYLINGSAAALRLYADKYLDVQEKHDVTTKAVVEQLVIVTRQMEHVLATMEKESQKFEGLARAIGRRTQDS